jgi:hypothetical protein
MTPSEAQKIIDEAIADRFFRNFDAQNGAEFMLQFLNDRPELLVVVPEVADLIRCVRAGLEMGIFAGQLKYACEETMKPFTKEGK